MRSAGSGNQPAAELEVHTQTWFDRKTCRNSSKKEVKLAESLHIGPCTAAQNAAEQPVTPCRMLPSSLLLLSRAFTVTQLSGAAPSPAEGPAAELDSLKSTLGALNKEVLDEVGLEVGQLG